jgi:RHS repeat-associated protein
MTGSVNATNIFLSDPQNLTGFSQVLEELPAVGAAPTASYTLGSQIISQEKGGTNSYLMADGHGSTRFLTDTNGVISDRYSYDAYGVALDFTFGTLNPPRTAILYSGERFDSDLQQYYLRARYYNPTVGRFGAQDQQDGTPNDPLSLHKYAYCQNNPVNGRDPSGNDDLASLTMAMSIGASLDLAYNGVVTYFGSKLLTEATVAGESLQQIEGQPATPNVDTATIIVHGVAGHTIGWSLEDFQPRLKAAQNTSEPLNQDFYEFDWGGFTVANTWPFLVPTRSVHTLAFVHLQAAQMLVWMKGYSDINVISHSWGTCLAYDLMNSGGVEMHDWVTMGSPLNHNISKPVWNTGKWVNCYSHYDPIVYLDMYPNPGWVSPVLFGPILSSIYFPPSLSFSPFNPPQVDVPVDMTTTFHFNEHTRYWNNDTVIDSIRNNLQ